MAILSIQSFVSKGYVGNRAATFVLERLGFEVWSIPTVLFSNHPGYGRFSGYVINPDDIQELFDGIVDIADLSEIDAIITGYVCSKDQPKTISKIIKQIKKNESDNFYVCDPAVANERGLFVDRKIAQSCSEFLFPLANIITPNIFELEYFSGVASNNLQSLIKACEFFFDYGPKAVLVKSVEMKRGYLSNLLLEGRNVWSIEVPKFAGTKNGAGDVYAAILTAELVKGKTFLEATEKAVSASWEIIKKSKSNTDINLISLQESLECPKETFSIKKLTHF